MFSSLWWPTLLLLLTLLGPGASLARAEEALSLPQVVRQTMAAYFSRDQEGMSLSYEDFTGKLPVSARYRQPAGVFVTLSLNGKPRACWGSVFPQQPDVVKATVYATIGALTREYRYPPIQPGEWRQLKPQVTVVRSVRPIKSLSQQNPLRDGLMVRSGARTGVILPGEARDAHYQLVLSRLKAGIQPNEPYQMYRIIADVYQ